MMKNKTKRRIAKNLEIGEKQATTWLARKRGTILENIDSADERCRATEGEGGRSEHFNQTDVEIMKE